MPLTPGEQLGPYEIVGLLGKGGMGEVYKARDPRLQRDVAIKTSAQRFSERFQIEARAIAALNHPNICQIYDVGPNYIVMEYVEGSSPQGPMSVDDALKIADQIASALEEAHSKKITHRDLKPGNIMVKADGTVKVLDFGLAKFVSASSTTEVGDDSPTLTMAATQAGMILGTAAYMSPEQARGKPVDTRADVWAFGVVVYEIVTGHRLFKGEDLTDTLASVVKVEPDLSRVPRRVKRMLEACLQKDPRKRLQAIGDMRLLLDGETAPADPVGASRKQSWLWPAVAAIFAMVAVAIGWIWLNPPAPELQSVQFALLPPAEERFINNFAAFSVSPDGRYIVFAGSGKNGPSMWLRPIDSLDARPLPGTGGPPNYSFWSPDSKSVAFFDTAQNQLRRIEITGGAALSLAANPSASASVSGVGTWNQDGVILFGGGDGIGRTSASGGGATRLTKVDAKQQETGHGFPQFLPDGRRFLFFVASLDSNVQGVYASSLDAPEQRTLIVRTDAKGVYVPPKGATPGYLLWMSEDNLVAQRFNVGKLEREGDPISVAEGIARNSTATIRAAFWASDAGVLIYLAGAGASLRNRLVWMARDGKVLGDAIPETTALVQPSLSPDGTRLAMRRQDTQGTDIGVWEFARSVATRLTFEKEVEQVPVWSPDSKWIAYSMTGKGIFRKDSSGSGQPEQLVDVVDAIPIDWSHNGKFLLYRISGGQTGRDIWAMPLADGAKPAGKPFAILAVPYDQSTARLSPDGKWLAYSSAESGISEIYIQPFVTPDSSAGPGGRWQVSNKGGNDIAWRSDGRELYYEANDGDMMAVGIQVEGAGLRVDAAKSLFKAGTNVSDLHSFDATPDGQKFLVQLPVGGTEALTVVTNWQAALRK